MIFIVISLFYYNINIYTRELAVVIKNYVLAYYA